MQVSHSARERYQRVIESIDNLPSLPAIVTRLMQVVNSPDTSADDAAKLIEKDPALTSKMLRLANSAFYGIPRSISSVASAVVILGFNTIRSLVLSASVMQMFPGEKSGFDKDRFWKHSIVCAIAAKIMVRHFMSIRMMDPESAFCAGILHDIGKLIFNEFVHDDYMEAFEFSAKKKVPLVQAEKMILGIDHAEIGKILSDKWALPLDLEFSLVYHHEPAAANNITDLVTTVHMADILANRLGMGLIDDGICNDEWNQARAVLKITDEDYSRIFSTLESSVEKSVEFLSIIN